jgi:hypothetical protein
MAADERAATFSVIFPFAAAGTAGTARTAGADAAGTDFATAAPTDAAGGTSPPGAVGGADAVEVAGTGEDTAPPVDPEATGFVAAASTAFAATCAPLPASEFGFRPADITTPITPNNRIKPPVPPINK